MRLANELSERAILQEKILDLRNRMEINTVIQEGEKPAEDPWELLAGIGFYFGKIRRGPCFDQPDQHQNDHCGRGYIDGTSCAS